MHQGDHTMKLAEVDLSDVRARYTVEVESFRALARVVAHEIFDAHLRERLSRTSLEELRATTQDFGRRLLDYLVDLGDVLVDERGRAHAPGFDDPAPSHELITAWAADNPQRSSLAYFLSGCRDVAGGVLGGGDGLRLVRANDPRGIMNQWEHVMLHGTILEPCRLFAARALASRLALPGSVVLEGGAGVGVVLRTLLTDERLRASLDNLGEYHFTELDPGILAMGRMALSRVAPESLRRAMIYRRLDLDAIARDLSTSGLAPRSVDAVVLEHVLYDVADLHGTLVALRELLKPDGVLIFTGAFRGRPASFFPCEMLQLTLASYRRAKLDPPYRASVGYLTLREWSLSLERAGFEATVYPSPAAQERFPHGGIIARPV